MIEVLLNIEGVGGVLIQDDIVVRTTHELEFMSGWTREHLDVYCSKKNLKITVLRMFRQADLFEETEKRIL